MQNFLVKNFDDQVAISIEEAWAESCADLAAGRFHVETAEAHLARVIACIANELPSHDGEVP
ncbi:MAG: hypothetical protein KA142_05630 [Chromatiaceae bacterium]|nr:hypothetical protein [Chromatiaceae bacterium]